MVGMGRRGGFGTRQVSLCHILELLLDVIVVVLINCLFNFPLAKAHSWSVHHTSMIQSVFIRIEIMDFTS
jgi:hypothetical protein